MKWYVCALIAIFSQLSHGQLIKRAYPTFAPCDPRLISLIHHYWEDNDAPHNALQSMEESGTLTVLHTSYNYLTSIIKCIYLNFYNGTGTAILVPKNGNAPFNLTYSAWQDEDHVIRGKLPQNDSPEYKWNWYPISIDKRISTFYVCSDTKGSQEVPLMSIALVKSDKKLINLPEINRLYEMLQEWGIKIKHSYGEECVLEQNV